jgi:hypothetical protein
MRLARLGPCFRTDAHLAFSAPHRHALVLVPKWPYDWRPFAAAPGWNSQVIIPSGRFYNRASPLRRSAALGLQREASWGVVSTGSSASVLAIGSSTAGTCRKVGGRLRGIERGARQHSNSIPFVGGAGLPHSADRSVFAASKRVLACETGTFEPGIPATVKKRSVFTESAGKLQAGWLQFKSCVASARLARRELTFTSLAFGHVNWTCNVDPEDRLFSGGVSGRSDWCCCSAAEVSASPCDVRSGGAVPRWTRPSGMAPLNAATT